jgi:hypothetical protein
VGLHAEVDFGPCNDLSKVGPKLTALNGRGGYPLKLLDCPAGTSKSVWETDGATIPMAPGAGPQPITLDWEETSGKVGRADCKSGGGNPCKGSFGVVQRGFSATDSRSGPIRFAQVWESGFAWANSLERCSAAQSSCSHDLVVKIGIDQSLEGNAKSRNDPKVELRVFHEAANNPSQNQALDCDPASHNLRDELIQGCGPTYERNQGSTCPGTASVLWAGPTPWDCVAVQTGGDVNQVLQGMNARVHGSVQPTSCVNPNNWSDFPDLDLGDPRVIPVFVTGFGSFAGSGNDTIPVTNFATFYVTGWAGQGGGATSQSICPTDDTAEPGTIVGHFIKYVQSLNDGTASSEPCDFEELGPCEAVLTE